MLNRPDRKTGCFVVAADADRTGRPRHLGHDINTVKVSASDTGGAFALFEYSGHSRGGPPLHFHPDQDETFFVREGAYIFVCGSERKQLGSGDTIFLPRGVPHSFRQLDERGRLLFMFSPAGDMEAFFAEAAQLERPPSPDEAAALFAAHGMQVAGPPIAAEAS